MDIERIVYPDGERHIRVGNPGKAPKIFSKLRNADDLWDISLLADAMRGRGAKRVTLIAPYLGYERQDRRVYPGDAAGGPLLLRQLAAAGITRVVTPDLHSDKLMKGVGLAVTSVNPWPLFAAALKKKFGRVPLTIAGPDYGALKRAKAVAGALPDAAAVWVEKHRVSGAHIRSGLLHGRTKGDTAVIVDDVLSTGVTVEAAAKALRKAGIRRIWVAVTHAVFSDGAAKRLERLGVERLLVSDSLPKPKVKVPIETVSVQALLKKAAH